MSEFDRLLEEELEKQKKKKQETVTPSKTLGNSLSYLPSYTATNSGTSSQLTSNDIDDIAPVIPLGAQRKLDEVRKWSDSKTTDKKWYESGLFEDGYDFGDVTKTILGIDTKKKEAKVFEDPVPETSLEELKQKKETEKDTGERLKYTQLYNQKALAQYSDIFSKTKMDGQSHTILEEITILANMKSGKEKDKRKEAVLAKFDELGIDRDFYAHFAGDGEFDWGTFGKWIQSGLAAGLNSFNKGLADTADVLLGNPLKALGWENNPFSAGADYYEDLYNSYAYNRNLYAEKLGGGAWNFGGEFVEGTAGALPNALLAIMTSGASLTTSTTLANQAAYNAGNILTKAGLTTEAMMKNPQFWTSFARTLGSDYNEAKEMGASDTAAAFGSILSSMINAGIEIGPDGGSGIQGLPNDLKQGGNSALAWVESWLEEGGEEGLQKFVNEGVAKVIYGSDEEILNPLEYGKEMALGTLSGMALGGGQIAAQSVANAVAEHNANKLTETEKAVVDKIVEQRIAEEEKATVKQTDKPTLYESVEEYEAAQKGEPLTNKRKAEIRAEVLQALEKGNISTETIEEVLGGDNYTAYQDIVKQDNEALEELAQLYEGDELKQKAEEFINNSKRSELAKTLSDSVYDMVKDTRLGESYRDRARRGQLFEADVTKYDEKQKVTIQRAIDSGVLNNTNRTHEMVDFIARVSADTGVLFDFTNNAKLKDTIFAVNGKTVDGYITKDGITINVNSPRYINTIVGHEITHAFEGTELYDTLEKALFEYAKEKGNYKDVLKEAYDMYSGEEGYQGYEGLKKIKKEAVANLVGDYLFTDQKFINHLAKHQNIFQKVWNEVKYMVKIARAGSNEAKKLLEVQRAFEKAYRGKGTVATEVDSDVRFSLRKADPPKKTQEVYKLMRLTEDGKLAPLFIDTAEPLEVGKWYDADSPNMDFLKEMPSGIFLVDANTGEYQSYDDYLKESGEKKTKYPSKNAINKATEEGKRWVYIEDTSKGQKRFGGETRKYWNLGINGSGSVSTFSMRPGYHAGSLPTMRQIGKGKNRDLRDDTFVWTVGEVPADIEYQTEADQNPDKDIPTHIPTDGYYLKATNADKAKSQADRVGWYVAGGYKINRIISDSEARQIIDNWNKEHPDTPVEYDYDRESGMDFDAEQMKLVPRDVKYSLSHDSEGNKLSKEQAEFFKDSKAVDSKGNLLKVYHTTNSDFTVFDKSKKGETTGDYNTYLGFFFADTPEYMNQFPEFKNGKTETYYLNMKNPIDMNNISKQAFLDIVEATGGDVQEAAELYDREYKDEIQRAKFRGDNSTIMEMSRLLEEMTGDYFDYAEFYNALKPNYEKLMAKGYDGVINSLDGRGWANEYIVLDSNQAKLTSNTNPTADPDIRYSLSKQTDTSFTPNEIQAIQSIGRKSINAFDSNDIAATEKFAQRYWEEIGTKSPFYRAWFGDWRAKDITPVQIATKQGDTRVDHYNKDTGWTIQNSGKVHNETKKHHSIKNREAVPYLPYIDEIIENAVLLDTEGIGNKKSENSLLMHYLYAVADIGNGPEVLKLHVEEMYNPGQKKTDKRAYTLQNIEKAFVAHGGVQGKTPSSRSNATNAVNTVADLFALVKQMDADFVPNESSKIVNADGTPKVMYHGSPEQFTVFDRSKAKSSGLYGRGFYFTDSTSHAGTYGNLYEVYLNIRNPLQSGGATVSRSQVRDYLEAVAENEDYSIENYGTYDVDVILDNVMGKARTADAFKVIQDINITAVGDMVEAAELFNSVNGTTFDGIVVPTETVAFYPEQIKSATDNVGTFDKSNTDIQHSLSVEGKQPVKQGNWHISGKDIAYEDIAPVAESATVPVAETQPQPIVAEESAEELFPDDLDSAQYETESFDSIDDADAPPEVETAHDEFADTTALNKKTVTDLSKKVKSLLGINNNRTGEVVSMIEAYSRNEYRSTEQLFEELKEKFGTYTEKYVDEPTKELKALLRGYRIKVSDSIKSEIADYADLMRRNFGRVRFSKEGMNVDEVYEDLHASYPGYFPESIINPTDQLLRIIDVANLEAEAMYEMEVDEESLVDAARTIARTVRAYQQSQMQALSNREGREAFNSLMKSADEFAPADDIAPVVKQKEKTAKIEKPAEIAPDGHIKTVKERLTAKMQNLETELANNRRLRVESWTDYDNEIARAQAEYNSKSNKNTVSANDLLRRIERLNRMKHNTDADYAKRISDLEERVASVGEEIRTGESTAEQGAMRLELHNRILSNIRTKFEERGFDFDNVLRNAKDLPTFATVDNTPQRVMEKALGYKQGQILSDLTVNQVAQNETKGIKWLNAFTDRKNGVLAKLSKQYHIKPGSKESAAAQMYAEGFYVTGTDKNGEWFDGKSEIVPYGDAELAQDFPDAKTRENIKGLARDPQIRRIYDETLAKINESRARNAYPEIQRLDNYFLHFRAMDDAFSRLGIPFNPKDIKAKDLPTDLNGVTADLKPGQPYFASAMHRTGKRTSFDLLGGLERYLSSAKNQIYHIDDIQTLRALRNYVADTYGQANGLKDLDLLTEEEAQARIKDVYKSHLSTFAKFLNEEANFIAGKTALIDRGFEGVFGRKGMAFLDTVNRQVGSNMVGFNVSSSLTNFLPVAQTLAKTNKADFVKAFAQTVSNKVGSVFGRGDSFAEDSSVVIRRKGEERFYRTPWQKAGDAGYMLMGAVDDISTELIARTKYNEFTRKGMDSKQAHYETDKWVSRLMGDRSIGQQPQLYNSKMLGIITKFQLEVRNQLDAQFYDTIQEEKVSNEHIQNGLLRNAKTAAKIGSTFFQLAVAQHLFGKAFESVAGYNPAFDIISVLIKAFGWDDDEDDEDTVLDNIEEGFLELLGDLPYTSTLTGGRIPISSALPVTEFVTGKDQYGNEVSRWGTLASAVPYYVLPGGYGQAKKTYQGLSMFDDDLPVSGSYTNSGNLRFPVEDTIGNRVQAGLFGQYASANARDYFDNERSPLKPNQIQEYIDVDLPIADYWEYREGLSEHPTLDSKGDYIGGLDLPISKKNILINNIAQREEPIDMTDYDKYPNFHEFDWAEQNEEKYAFLQEHGMSYSDYEKLDENSKKAYTWAYNNPEKYEFVKSLGLSAVEYNALDDDSKDAYTWAYDYPENYTVSKAVTSDVVEYRRYAKALDEIRADKDANGKSISGSAKEKKIDYINSLDLDYGAKLILFKNEYNADDTYNSQIVEYLNSRDDISYEDAVTILKKLGFTVTADGTVRW